MHKIIMYMVSAAVFILTGQSACFAYTAHLTWNTVADARLAGYMVYYKQDSNVQPFNGTGATEGASPIVLPGQSSNPSAIINGLDPAHSYYFAVTSYITVNSVNIQSIYSNIASVPVLPTVSISSPAGNDKVGGMVSVTATASVGTTSVELIVDGYAQIHKVTAAPYTFAWDTLTLNHGPYSLSAKAYYSPTSSIAGQSGAVSVTVVKAKNLGTGSYSETLQLAYDNASSGATLMMWNNELSNEDIICGQSKSVTIKGGYDQGFSSNSGYTSIDGSFTIGQGTVVMDRLIIM